jgi:hypothetical protein
MDEQHPIPVGPLEETFKGNLRIRLHEVQTHDGSKTHLVEIAAWSSWAGQEKLLFARGGIDRDAARNLFNVLTKILRGYDWQEDQFLLEGDE